MGEKRHKTFQMVLREREQRGITQGMNRGMEKVACKMLLDNKFTINDIVDLTDLTPDRIEELRSTLKQ